MSVKRNYYSDAIFNVQQNYSARIYAAVTDTKIARSTTWNSKAKKMCMCM